MSDADAGSRGSAGLATNRGWTYAPCWYLHRKTGNRRLLQYLVRPYLPPEIVRGGDYCDLSGQAGLIRNSANLSARRLPLVMTLAKVQNYSKLHFFMTTIRKTYDEYYAQTAPLF